MTEMSRARPETEARACAPAGDVPPREDGTVTTSSTRRAPGERSTLRSVAVPSEHGGWGLTLEPGLLGLLVAPGAAGVCLAVAAFVAFLARTPLKVVLVDRRRGRWLGRTRDRSRCGGWGTGRPVGIDRLGVRARERSVLDAGPRRRTACLGAVRVRSTLSGPAPDPRACWRRGRLLGGSDDRARRRRERPPCGRNLDGTGSEGGDVDPSCARDDRPSPQPAGPRNDHSRGGWRGDHGRGRSNLDGSSALSLVLSPSPLWSRSNDSPPVAQYLVPRYSE